MKPRERPRNINVQINTPVVTQVNTLDRRTRNSYKMEDAKFPPHPLVEEFLKSSKMEMVYTGFKGNAQIFINVYSPEKNSTR